jgi:hypothetical protein
MRRLTRTGWVGVALLCLGLAPLICWTVWFRTRTWCPVSIPISLAPGSHFTTGEFLINLNARYDIEIDTENTPALDTFRCQKPTYEGCSEAFMNVAWVLSSDGTTLQGTSPDTRPGGWSRDDTSWYIGEFEAQKGRRYKLSGNVVAAGSKLKDTNPHVRVSVGATSLETGLVVSGLLKFVATVIVLIGGALLIASLLVQRRHRVPAKMS